MDDIRRLRSMLDELDDNLCRLLTVRAQLAERLGDELEAQGKPRRDIEHERTMLARIATLERGAAQSNEVAERTAGFSGKSIENKPSKDGESSGAMRYSAAARHFAAEIYRMVMGRGALSAVDGMRIYDITRELISTPAYPGDPIAERTTVMAIANGDNCNLSKLSMSAHNATHVDAPLHFVDGATDILGLEPKRFVGSCVVLGGEGIFTASDCERIPVCERLLLKGYTEVSVEAAQFIAESCIDLLGIESQSVGSGDTHRMLLGAGMTLVEGLDLSEIEEGEYVLAALPLKIEGAEGAPCRAILLG